MYGDFCWKPTDCWDQYQCDNYCGEETKRKPFENDEQTISVYAGTFKSSILTFVHEIASLQKEDKAIEELQKFYNVERVFDEIIVIDRVHVRLVGSPVWIQKHK